MAKNNFDVSKDYYAILGLDKSVEIEVINAAYRVLALKHHPDVHAGNTSEAEKSEHERMIALNEAHSVLADENMRRAYDAARRKATAGTQDSAKSPQDGATENNNYKKTRDQNAGGYSVFSVNRGMVGILLIGIVFVGLVILVQPTPQQTPSAQALQRVPETMSPSFDCAKVRSEVLKLICATPDLAMSDQQLAAAYSAAMAIAPSPSDLKKDERAWVQRRNNSKADAEGLRRMYKDRIAFLAKEIGAANSKADNTDHLERAQQGQSASLQASENHDPRSLTPEETKLFLPLICADPSPGGQHYSFHCGGLVGYPYTSLGTDVGLTFTSVIYGHMITPNADQAYVSYGASSESHATDFGGGILFEQEATGWRLIGWYPGGQMDDCLMLTPGGLAKMLCLFGHMGQGEVETSLVLATIPPTYERGRTHGDYRISVIKADDNRGGSFPNFICSYPMTPSHPILLDIHNLARSRDPEAVAEAGIEYVTSETAATSCAKSDFANAELSKGTLKLKWDGKTIDLVPGYNFAPAPF